MWLFLCVVLIFFIIRYSIFRRQIREVCRQLEFLRQEQTNKRIQTDLSNQDIISLANQINALLDEQERDTGLIQKKEDHLKETLANISHDIRTPLTSMKGFFDLYLQEPDPKQRKHYETIIHSRMDDLSTLLEELFTYTKLQDTSYELALAECNFTQLVMSCLFDFYEQWKEAGIEPRLEISETPATVLCNDTAVRRILTNLLRNATIHGGGSIHIEYITDDGQLLFRCSNPVTEAEEPDPDQVFDRFYRADTARSQTSSGLGLSIAIELAERMGGTMQAAVEDGIFIIEVHFQTISNHTGL